MLYLLYVFFISHAKKYDQIEIYIHCRRDSSFLSSLNSSSLWLNIKEVLLIIMYAEIYLHVSETHRRSDLVNLFLSFSLFFSWQAVIPLMSKHSYLRIQYSLPKTVLQSQLFPRPKYVNCAWFLRACNKSSRKILAWARTTG